MVTATQNPTNELVGSPNLGIGDMIVATPGTCGGKPRIAGTRIKVRHVYEWVEKMGMTPRQIVDEYPHLTLAQIHAALAYYWSHRDEIQQEIVEGERIAEEIRVKFPSKLSQKLAEKNLTNDSDNPLSSR